MKLAEIFTVGCWLGYACCVKFSGNFMHLVNQEKSIKQLVLAQRNKSSG